MVGGFSSNVFKKGQLAGEQRMKSRLLLTMTLLLAGPSSGKAATRYVPSQYGTIQSAIIDCNNGDVIIVNQGTYYENINFGNKNITLTSIDPNNPDVVANTIIDGQGRDSVVKFEGDEEPNSLLTGFTITNGFAPGSSPGNYGFGGGIHGQGTHATVLNCRIVNNSAGWEGGGVYY